MIDVVQELDYVAGFTAMADYLGVAYATIQYYVRVGSFPTFNPQNGLHQYAALKSDLDYYKIKIDARMRARVEAMARRRRVHA